MSLLSAMRKLADKVRAIPSLPAIAVRTTSVKLRTRTYAGGRVGAEGTVETVDLLITPRPKVREIDQHEAY